MANLRDNPKGLSEKSTKIRTALTKKATVKGVTYQARITNININLDKDQVDIVGFVNILDNEGNELTGRGFSETHPVRDLPSQGTMELDSNGFIKPETFKEVIPENLSITEWDKSVGDMLILPAISFFEQKQGWLEVE